MKRVYRDERGSSLVMTIIAMAFISILAVAVITMTITNIRLKQAQKESQKNFYNADSIVDAIRAGLYDLAAESAEKAYEESIVLYGSSNTSMKQVYTKKFMSNMVNELSEGQNAYPKPATAPDTYRYHYSDAVIRRFLTDEQNGSAAMADGYQSAVSDLGGFGYMDIDVDSLVLKDVKVMKTDNDYQTMIKTDIRVNIPNITEETDSEYLAYALIADNQIISENAVTNSNIVNGSVYAGISKSNITGAPRPESGIIVSSGSKLSLTSDYVITRGDIRMDGNGVLNINTGIDKDSGVYAENIETKQEKVKAKNVLTIDGNTYIADDMELWGNGDQVTLKGNYYGYNYTNNYSSPGVQASKQSEYSSAILINGKNTELNMEGVKNLMLAGYTFISKGLNAYQSPNANPNMNEEYDNTKYTNYKNPDIGMGESMTLKATQLAYYVPSDYVKEGVVSGMMSFKVDNDDAEEFSFDYQGYQDYLQCSDASFDITKYVNSAAPLVCYYRNDLNVKGDLRYFYLNFISDNMAKRFYRAYQKC
ncbi:MAG: pilus assembly PilX N-terminal domain-containing protein, partial [Ruminococcus flavefaciens]|nr:pilus assembly PilX N-terminal domain-containing protein [Ruminococcus flavefaciens]